ncbi:MAG: hypothetical protein ACNS61_02875 [Candidatus Wenzhouxiangella sp. M2_3B_020]
MALPGQSLDEAVGNFDLILSFESLERDIEALRMRLGISGELGRYNASGRRGKLGYYDEELAEHIHDLFREEIGYFDFPRPLA